MKVLIVLAHPEPTSFTAALKDAAVAAIEKAGHTAVVSDLYAEQFNPVAGRHDFVTVADPARFHYQTEQLHASRNNGFAPDLVREQARLAQAALVILIFPLWWGGMPAILKGWFDRVCAYGFAYADGKRFDSGYLLGRRGLLAVTTGGSRERFTNDGVYGEIGHVLHGVRRCMFEYLGLRVADPYVAYAAPRVDDAQRAAYLRDWADTVTATIQDPEWLAQCGNPAAYLDAQLDAQRRADAGNTAWSQPR
jgi:NAD(P)H dehydrogenase (quinone)